MTYHVRDAVANGENVSTVGADELSFRDVHLGERSSIERGQLRETQKLPKMSFVNMSLPHLQ